MGSTCVYSLGVPRREDIQAFGTNIQGSIEIAIMLNTARARPISIRQRERVGHRAARVACLAGRMRHPESRLIPFLAFEARIARPLFEEVYECPVQVAQSFLKRLRIPDPPPGACVSRQRCALLRVGLHPKPVCFLERHIYPVCLRNPVFNRPRRILHIPAPTIKRAIARDGRLRTLAIAKLA